MFNVSPLTQTERYDHDEPEIDEDVYEFDEALEFDLDE